MKMTRLKSLAALLLLSLLPGFGHTEDIDIYNGDTTGGGSNVLIVLDNSTNWSGTMNNSPSTAETAFCGNKDTGTFFCAQKLSLVTLLKMIDPNDSTQFFIKPSLGIGLMLYTEKSTGSPGSIPGGYIRFGVRKMTSTGLDWTTGNRGALIKLLTDLTKDSDIASNSTENYSFLMWEAFKYYGGGTGVSPISNIAWGPVPYAGVQGNGTAHRDYPGNNGGGSALNAGADSNVALTSSAQDGSARYVSPITDPCGKNYIVMTSASASQDSDNNNNSPTNSFWRTVGSNMARVVNSSGTEITGSFADEATRYMFNSDVSPLTGMQNIITHTIAQYNPTNTGGLAKMVTQLTSMALQGGGNYYAATSVDQLTFAFGDIITTIQAKDSVFVSAALPVSVNTQGTYINQVFIGMFRPDADGSPKWLGNLKQFQLKFDAVTNTLRLGDSSTPPLYAIDPSTGFITALAKSFWTTPSTFWTNWVPGRTASASDSPDGPEVQKGGVAQRLREDNLTTQANRKVYTCAVGSTGLPNCTAGLLSATPFNATTLNPSSTGTPLAFDWPAAWKTSSTASTDITNLINWARGTDNQSNEFGPGGTTTVRPTIHGDVLHSLPVALNYANRVVVYYGSNEGMLHAIEGKKTAGGAGGTPGSELWAFVAPEHLKKLERLSQQAPLLVLPSTPTHTTCLTTDTNCNKDYFFDGPIGAYQEGSTAIIYAATRRGGNFIYAIDVSDPDNPKYKFKLSPSTSGLTNLGQTWSMPKVVKLRDGTAAGRVVLIFGGGYDLAEDVGSTGTTGRGVYVVDALTGALVKQFLTAANGTDVMSTSVPSDVAVLDIDRDGFVNRAYVGDMAGNVWRMDLDDGSATNPSTGWTLNKIASLGAYKFFYPPDVVASGSFSAVLIGSGDREKPTLSTTSDRFFMVKDVNVGAIVTPPTVITQSDLVVNTSTTAQLNAASGWYYDLRTGEKAVNGPLTVGGVVYFGTNQPVATLVCKANLGQARSYALDFLSGGGIRPPDGSNAGDDIYSIVLTGGGFPPTPVAGLVDLSSGLGGGGGGPGGGPIVPFCLGCGALRSPFEAMLPDVNPTPVRKKIYWNIKKDK
jgi:type IV pilus assembly protein PilY1